MGTIVADFLKGLFEIVLDQANAAVDLIVAYCLQNPFDATSYIHFSWINALLGYMQVIAFGVALAMRLFGAAKEGLLSSFRSEPYFAAEWLFDTVWVLALICAAPSICIFCTGFTIEVAHDICNISQGATLFGDFCENVSSVIEGDVSYGFGTSVFAIILSVVVCIIMMYYIFSVMLQCLKRQILIVFLSVVAPIALCADSMRDKNFDRAMGCIEVILYAGVISALQIIMLEAAFGIVLSLTSEVDTFVVWACISVALFASIKALPEWLDKYLPGPVSAGRAGGKVSALGAGAALRSLSSVGRGGRAAKVASAAKG